MNGDDVQVVRDSFERVRRRADHVVKFFYSHLFANNPGVRDLFPADMDEQFDRLFAALGHLVSHLDDPALPGFLAQLGRDHRKFDVTAEQYDAVGASLVAALRFGSGQVWDERTERAWTTAYGVAAAAMLQGAAEAEGKAEPAYWDATVLDHRLHRNHTAVLTVLPDRPYPYRAGQYATLQSERRPRVWRPYSLAGAPRGDGILEFHVARVAGGLLSTALCDEVVPGDRLRLGPASGTATVPADVAPAITLLAAGSGWSAVKAVLEELVQVWPQPRLRLELIARSEGHYYDLPLMTALTRRYPWLEVSWWYTKPYENRARAVERLHAGMVARGDWDDQDVYISGPPAFVDELAELLTRCGVRPGRLRHDPLPPPVVTAREQRMSHAEYFLSPRPTPWIDPAARTGQTAAGQTAAGQGGEPEGGANGAAGRDGQTGYGGYGERGGHDERSGHAGHAGHAGHDGRPHDSPYGGAAYGAGPVSGETSGAVPPSGQAETAERRTGEQGTAPGAPAAPASRWPHLPSPLRIR